MSRSINESINQLQTSLSDIKTSLSAKNVEGGEQLKVSEVAGLINQIEAGKTETFEDKPKLYSIEPTVTTESSQKFTLSVSEEQLKKLHDLYPTTDMVSDLTVTIFCRGDCKTDKNYLNLKQNISQDVSITGISGKYNTPFFYITFYDGNGTTVFLDCFIPNRYNSDF